MALLAQCALLPGFGCDPEVVASVIQHALHRHVAVAKRAVLTFKIQPADPAHARSLLERFQHTDERRSERRHALPPRDHGRNPQLIFRRDVADGPAFGGEGLGSSREIGVAELHLGAWRQIASLVAGGPYGAPAGLRI